MGHAINHCGLTTEVREKGLTTADFQEAVMERAGEIITGAQTGQRGKRHKFGGVELVAVAIANHVIGQGARQVANDLGVNLDELLEHAASTHISGC